MTGYLLGIRTDDLFVIRNLLTRHHRSPPDHTSRSSWTDVCFRGCTQIGVVAEQTCSSREKRVSHPSTPSLSQPGARLYHADLTKEERDKLLRDNPVMAARHFYDRCVWCPS